jgi:hypothetical protein
MWEKRVVDEMFLNKTFDTIIINIYLNSVVYYY